MNTVVVLVGVAGAGKSTLIASSMRIPGVRILQPSTTRPARENEVDEYDWCQRPAWNNADYAWIIEARGHLYGMRKSQLQDLEPGEIGLTVFHPGNLQHLHQYRQESDLDFVTVGLDTIETHQQMKTRVSDDDSRDEGPAAFTAQREIVRECDAVLRGDADTVREASAAILRAMVSRGVLDKKSITSLIRAGTLLQDADIDNVQPASYDLSVGGSIWCKGEENELKPDELFKIPPYSYVLVEAREQAHLPNFIVAHYDLKVSLFMHGVVLSNGPQVDPGFRGILLCMLFNGSDRDVGLRRGEHFATIEFLVTNQVTEGYKGKHQDQRALAKFMTSTAAAGPGGTILDRMTKIEGTWERFRNTFIFPVTGVLLSCIAIQIALLIWNYNTLSDVHSATKQVEERTETLDSLLYEVQELKKRVEEGLSQLQRKQSSPSDLSVPDSFPQSLPLPSDNIVPQEIRPDSAISDPNETTRTLDSKP